MSIDNDSRLKTTDVINKRKHCTVQYEWKIILDEKEKKIFNLCMSDREEINGTFIFTRINEMWESYCIHCESQKKKFKRSSSSINNAKINMSKHIKEKHYDIIKKNKSNNVILNHIEEEGEDIELLKKTLLGSFIPYDDDKEIVNDEELNEIFEIKVPKLIKIVPLK